jgi:hypothetical protein
MKNDKREITLNEADSIKDMLFIQKMLLQEYGRGICLARRKEVRNTLLDSFASVAEDVFFLQDLLETKIGKSKN